MNTLHDAFGWALIAAIAVYIRYRYQKYKIRLMDSLAGTKEVHGVAGKSIETSTMRISKHNRIKGSEGEKAVGAEIERIAERFGLQVLHDLSVPNSTANIDHVLVGRRAVFIIDAKNYRNTLSIRENRQGQDQLYIGNYNQTKLARNVFAAKKEMKEYLRQCGVRTKVIGVLCFYEANSKFNSFKVVEGAVICTNDLMSVVIKYAANRARDFEIEDTVQLILDRYPLKNS
jgi:hypothetical protein